MTIVVRNFLCRSPRAGAGRAAPALVVSHYFACWFGKDLFMYTALGRASRSSILS
jgi:hypothetical protein